LERLLGRSGRGWGVDLGGRVPATTRIAIHRARADLFFAVSEYERSRAEADQRLALAR